MKRGKGLLVQGTRCTPGVYNWFFEILDYLPRVAAKFYATNLLINLAGFYHQENEKSNESNCTPTKSPN